jgi:hypothetical protein
VPCVTRRANRGGEPSVKKDSETEHSGVFASPGLPLAQFLTAESGLNHELCPDNRENAVRLPRKSFAIARLPLTPALTLDLPDSAQNFRSRIGYPQQMLEFDRIVINLESDNHIFL